MDVKIEKYKNEGGVYLFIDPNNITRLNDLCVYVPYIEERAGASFVSGIYVACVYFINKSKLSYLPTVIVL